MTEVAMANAKRIIIIGAGIGGLAAGLALQRRGFRVIVYERAAEVDEGLEAISSCVPLIDTCDYATGAVVTTTDNRQIFTQHGMAVLQVHRENLHRLLMEAVRANDPQTLRADHEFVGLEQDADGVSVRFANGADRADVVIGAHGNRSAIRSKLFSGDPPKFAGQAPS
jgi:salicylate hydroxylase